MHLWNHECTYALMQVWKVVRRADCTTYALKEVTLTGLSRKEQEDCVHEVHVLAKMDCQYITKYFDCFVENQKLYIVTEYAPGVCTHEPRSLSDAMSA
jgi:hypothetical protein